MSCSSLLVYRNTLNIYTDFVSCNLYKLTSSRVGFLVVLWLWSFLYWWSCHLWMRYCFLFCSNLHTIIYKIHFWPWVISHPTLCKCWVASPSAVQVPVTHVFWACYSLSPCFQSRLWSMVSSAVVSLHCLYAYLWILGLQFRNSSQVKIIFYLLVWFIGMKIKMQDKGQKKLYNQNKFYKF